MASLTDPSLPQRSALINRAVNYGLISNLFLAVLKITVAIFGHSRALLADGVNSCSDVAYYIVVKVFTALAGKPADKEHPYGHHQMESISALVVGAFVITTAIAIFWDSVNAAVNVFSEVQQEPMKFQIITFFTAIFTILLKSVLFLYTKFIAKKTDSAAVFALTQDHRNDIFASIGAAVGIGLAWIGIPLGDPIAGAIVALIVLRTGINILRESSAELMDTVPGESLDKNIRQSINSVSGVIDIEELSAHRFGPYIVVNIIIGVDGNISVCDGDRIATNIENKLYQEIELLRRVYIHYHPAKKTKYK
jgi:cation diffusion facilitator family transporter